MRTAGMLLKLLIQEPLCRNYWKVSTWEAIRRIQPSTCFAAVVLHFKGVRHCKKTNMKGHRVSSIGLEVCLTRGKGSWSLPEIEQRPDILLTELVVIVWFSDREVVGVECERILQSVDRNTSVLPNFRDGLCA